MSDRPERLIGVVNRRELDEHWNDWARFQGCSVNGSDDASFFVADNRGELLANFTW